MYQRERHTHTHKILLLYAKWKAKWNRIETTAKNQSDITSLYCIALHRNLKRLKKNTRSADRKFLEKSTGDLDIIFSVMEVRNSLRGAQIPTESIKFPLHIPQSRKNWWRVLAQTFNFKQHLRIICIYKKRRKDTLILVISSGMNSNRQSINRHEVAVLVYYVPEKETGKEQVERCVGRAYLCSP